MNVCLKTVLASLLVSALAPAVAGTITVSPTGVSAPSLVENFDGVNPLNGLSNQFARSGLSFQTLSGTGANLLNTSQCNNSHAGMNSGYLYIGVTTPCSPSSTLDSVSIKFSSAVSELSWTAFTTAVSAGYTVSAFNKGSMVASTVFNSSNSLYNSTVLFKGSVFDEVRIVESAAGYQYMGIDTMAWKTAAIPLPGTLPLLAIGVLGFGAIRRKGRGA